MMQHLVYRDGQGVFVAENGHGKGITDEDDIDSGLIDETRRGIVVGGQGCDRNP
jgi:hypothetical protein